MATNEKGCKHHESNHLIPGSPHISEPRVKTRDVFLSYSMNLDASYRRVRDRIRNINAYLKSKGLRTWFDEEQDLQGDDGSDISFSMKERRKAVVHGIQTSQMAIVFVTENYIKSACGDTFATRSLQSIFTYSYKNETLSVTHKDQTVHRSMQGPKRKNYVHDIIDDVGDIRLYNQGKETTSSLLEVEGKTHRTSMCPRFIRPFNLLPVFDTKERIELETILKEFGKGLTIVVLLDEGMATSAKWRKQIDEMGLERSLKVDCSVFEKVPSQLDELLHLIGLLINPLTRFDKDSSDNMTAEARYIQGLDFTNSVSDRNQYWLLTNTSIDKSNCAAYARLLASTSDTKDWYITRHFTYMEKNELYLSEKYGIPPPSCERNSLCFTTWFSI